MPEPPSPDLAAPALRADAQRNRVRLLDAAAQLFRARGLEVSMEDIAREAGVGVGTLYRRFRNRDELINALFESRIAEFAAIVHACASIPSGWDALVALLERMIQAQAEDRGLKQLFHAHVHDNPRVHEMHDLVLGQITAIVERAQADGALRPDIGPMDVVLTSFQVGAVADLTVEYDVNAWRRALALGLDGLRARPGAPGPLPPGPIDRAAFDQALQCWRPPVAPNAG